MACYLFCTKYTIILFIPLLSSNRDNIYCNDSKFSERQVWANSVDPNQTATDRCCLNKVFTGCFFYLHLFEALFHGRTSNRVLEYLQQSYWVSKYLSILQYSSSCHSIPTRNWLQARLTVYPPPQCAYQNPVNLSKLIFSALNFFMHIFNMSVTYLLSIKRIH